VVKEVPQPARTIKNVDVSLYFAVKTHKCVRGRGSHIF
jgi:hypothetical protein